jgi:glyoxylase-like metal-dependent hydrolase (beta-lactamase superfamily II)
MNWSVETVWEYGTDKIKLVRGYGLPVFYIETHDLLLQVGSSPEVFKNTIGHFNRVADFMIVPPPKADMNGENWSGFEFPLWRARFMDFMNPQQVHLAGYTHYTRAVYDRLALAMFGDYIKDDQDRPQSRWVAKKWVDDVLQVLPDDSLKAGSFTLQFSDSDVSISHPEKKFSWAKLFSEYYTSPTIDELKDHSFAAEDFGVMAAGTGVGSKPGNTSSFVVKIADDTIWVDPVAYAAPKARSLGIAMAGLSGILITHVHEDHIEGFVSCFEYYKAQNSRQKLYSSAEIFQQLRTIFEPVVGDLTGVFDFIPVSELEAAGNWQFRMNYHTIPTLGFFVRHKGQAIGVSGDTIFDETIHRSRFQNNEISQKELDDLSAEFFKECQLVFHDTNVTGDPVHTSLKKVEELAMKIFPAHILGYHLAEDIESDLVEKAETGKFYKT